MLKFPGVELEVSEVPVRRVVTRGSVRHDGRFASRKMARTLPWESSIELAFLMLAELDADVTQVYAQPFEIQWRGASGLRRHIPDFAVLRGASLEVHEVKPDKKAAAADVQKTAAWAERHCRIRGASYGLALESVLKAEPAFSHAGTVLRRLHDRIDESLAIGTVEYVRRHRTMELGPLADWVGRWGGSVESVVTLVAHNRLSVDLRRPIHRSSPVWSVESFPHRPRALPLAATPRTAA